MMSTQTLSKFNLDEKFDLFSDHWSPKIIASLNGQDVKIAKIEGDFPFHAHDEEDEMFLVWRGEITMEFEDRPTLTLGEGEGYVVPKGVVHRPRAEKEAWIILFEPAGVINTGNLQGSDYEVSAETL